MTLHGTAVCCAAGLAAKLEQATADHEAALTSTAAFNPHSQFPGRTLINIMNEAIKVNNTAAVLEVET